MKARMWAIALCAVVLLGCGAIGAATDIAPTEEAPAAEPTTAVPTLTPEPEATPAAPAPATGVPPSAAGQEALMDEWRPAIGDAALVFETCVVMYQTHSDFAEGVIDDDRARSELETEADFIDIVARGLASMPVPSDAVAPWLLRLEDEMGVLIELVSVTDDDAIGSPVVLDSLDLACGRLQNLYSEIAFASIEAGLTEASVESLSGEVAEMTEDLYNMTVWGR